MKIQCSSCDQRLEIPEELAGQTIECPACNASLVVPALASAPSAPVQVQQSAPQVAASEKPKSSIVMWVIASVAGIAVLVVFSIIFFSDAAVKTDGESQQSTTTAEAKRIDRVAGAKAPEISIHEAASEGNIEVVKQHLAAGTDVNARSEFTESTPLYLAVFYGHMAIAEQLIANGADVNAKLNSGYTLLHTALKNPEIVEFLIEEGADVNARGFDGSTPLDTTANKEIADFLRKHGGKTGEELKAEGK